MCWSAGASIAATTLGGAATVYAAKKGVPKERTFALGFFTLMELLQAVSYLWIGQCDLSGNKFLTYLGFIHIAFQIPVANAFMLSFVSTKTRKKWFRPVMIISFLASFLLLAKMVVPLVWNVPKEWMCKPGDALCGANACTYKGNWHLAWQLPLLGFDPGNRIYFLLVFILPIFYGSWRLSLFHFLVGPLPAALLTTNRNESPAIWCLFSIGILCAVFFSPLKRWFETPMRKTN
jgi:hypothetical protein